MARRLFKLLVSLVVAFGDAALCMVRRLGGLPQRTSCVVLYYHAVRAVDRIRFADQMDLLVRLTVPVDLEGEESLPPGSRYSAVTFDDAFVSVIENALPELQARDVPCIIFVPTGSINLHPSWIAPPHEDAAEYVASADALCTVAAQPLVRLGSHSVSHPDFRRLDDVRAMFEMADSKSVLERISGQVVRSFSFPHGAHTARSLDLVKQCGYARAFTIEPVLVGNVRGDFVVGRVRVEPHDWPIEFRLKVLGAYRWMAQASRSKQAIFGVLGVGPKGVQLAPRGP